MADASENASRYVVGIDLGTTNSAMAYVDSLAPGWRVETFRVPQLTAPGMVEARDVLPSFFYQPAAGEFEPAALRLPWDRDTNDRGTAAAGLVGVMARDHGETVPDRLIASAKSWLCHVAVDRQAELLPWHAADDVRKLSPVEASSRYLAHFRLAWNDQHPDDPLEAQDVILTLPASFDEVARELTVKAARLAGLPRVVLVEEPQAAFYAWIDAHRQQWESLVQPGQKILVCDIGGGTTDFTLIRVRASGDGQVRFHRVAVGDHLILGGDNLDLALAHYLESKLAGGGRLEPRAWLELTRRTRAVKETLLGANPPERLTLNLPTRGARLIGGGQQVEVTVADVHQVLLEGFLPRVTLADRPQARASGFQEWGLPFASDAAITRYLAAFLSAHRHAGDEPPSEASPRAAAAIEHDPARPDVVLFNGGFFESPVLRQRLLAVLSGWFSPAGGPAWYPQVLSNERLDLAVARGAAYYGMVRRGQGVRIVAGLPRSYYVGAAVGDAVQAVCLVPAGLEEGREVELSDRRFELTIRAPVEFPLYVSSLRLTDPAGALVAIDREQLTPLPPIRTVLETARRGLAEALGVRLHARLSEIGTLELWCGEIDGPRRWKLQFDVRAATETDRSGHTGAGEQQGVIDAALVDAAAACLRETFSRKVAQGGNKPEGIVKQLESLLQQPRRAWPSSLLRELWQVLIDLEPGRQFSESHEARWLWLVGFCLRPGYGMAIDDWRVAQTWRLLQGKRKFHSPAVRVEWLVLWRRIAGGLAAGQQRALADPILASLRPIMQAVVAAKNLPRKSPWSGSHEAAEVWRLLGSLELLPADVKTELGGTLLALAQREASPAVRDALVWAVGRLGARVPLYGPLNCIIDPHAAARWVDALFNLEATPDAVALALMQLARLTSDRYRDLDDRRRQRVLVWFDRAGASEHLRQLVAEGGRLADDEQGLLFGESLPHGLRLS